MKTQHTTPRQIGNDKTGTSQTVVMLQRWEVKTGMEGRCGSVHCQPTMWTAGKICDSLLTSALSCNFKDENQKNQNQKALHKSTGFCFLLHRTVKQAETHTAVLNRSTADYVLLPRELCSRGICHGRVSVCVCVSVTSRSSTKMAKRRNTQTTPHDSPVTLVF